MFKFMSLLNRNFAKRIYSAVDHEAQSLTIWRGGVSEISQFALFADSGARARRRENNAEEYAFYMKFSSVIEKVQVTIIP